MPSVLTSLIYNYLQMKYFQLYENIETRNNEKKFNKINYETWNKKEGKLKKEKSYYYARTKDFGKVDENEELIIQNYKSISLNEIINYGNFVIKIFIYLKLNLQDCLDSELCPFSEEEEETETNRKRPSNDDCKKFNLKKIINDLILGIF